MIEKLSFLGMNSFGILFSKLLLSETEFFKVYGSVMTVMKFQVVTVEIDFYPNEYSHRNI